MGDGCKEEQRCQQNRKNQKTEPKLVSTTRGMGIERVHQHCNTCRKTGGAPPPRPRQRTLTHTSLAASQSHTAARRSVPQR